MTGKLNRLNRNAAELWLVSIPIHAQRWVERWVTSGKGRPLPVNKGNGLTRKACLIV